MFSHDWWVYTQDVAMKINMKKEFILFSCQSLMFLIILYLSIDLKAWFSKMFSFFLFFLGFMDDMALSFA